MLPVILVYLWSPYTIELLLVKVSLDLTSGIAWTLLHHWVKEAFSG